MGTPRETDRASLSVDLFCVTIAFLNNNNFFDQISIPDSRYRIVFQLNSKQCLAACIQVKKTDSTKRFSFQYFKVVSIKIFFMIIVET